ncbi:hypothetical protein CC80DRAFT_506475 [Byssothecium circinans]|uniref:Uncharacterized protein n=1 Tax=Byssothecium circinans TaxID=147558 RepID=A0A6A5TUV6_9PLEO|nr:hypothetical protein CC80DRAFT_506475 [Byssothecium circinans]
MPGKKSIHQSIQDSGIDDFVEDPGQGEEELSDEEYEPSGDEEEESSEGSPPPRFAQKVQARRARGLSQSNSIAQEVEELKENQPSNNKRSSARKRKQCPASMPNSEYLHQLSKKSSKHSKVRDTSSPSYSPSASSCSDTTSCVSPEPQNAQPNRRHRPIVDFSEEEASTSVIPPLQTRHQDTSKYPDLVSPQTRPTRSPTNPEYFMSCGLWPPLNHSLQRRSNRRTPCTPSAYVSPEPPSIRRRSPFSHPRSSFQEVHFSPTRRRDPDEYDSELDADRDWPMQSIEITPEQIERNLRFKKRIRRRE